jgi:hypothetical protein
VVSCAEIPSSARRELRSPKTKALARGSIQRLTILRDGLIWLTYHIAVHVRPLPVMGITLKVRVDVIQIQVMRKHIFCVVSPPPPPAEGFSC